MTTHDDCTGYDFAAGSAFGLRSFDVDNLGRLKGVHHKRVWRPGENVAVCNAGDELKQGRCENDEHGCGFWAYHDGSTYAPGQVHGVIEGYGKTTVGTKGFRCEKARIVALVLPAAKAAKVERSWWDRFCLWSYRRTGWVATPTAILGALGAIGIIEGIAEGAWLALALAPLALAVAVVSVGANVRGMKLALGAKCPPPAFLYDPEPLTPELVAKIRRNYPEVEFYESVAAMTKAHPIDQALEPTPETDPSFWEDDWTPGSDPGMTWALPSVTLSRSNLSCYRTGGVV